MILVLVFWVNVFILEHVFFLFLSFIYFPRHCYVPNFFYLSRCGRSGRAQRIERAKWAGKQTVCARKEICKDHQTNIIHSLFDCLLVGWSSLIHWFLLNYIFFSIMYSLVVRLRNNWWHGVSYCQKFELVSNFYRFCNLRMNRKIVQRSYRQLHFSNNNRSNLLGCPKSFRTYFC